MIHNIEVESQYGVQKYGRYKMPCLYSIYFHKIYY